MVPVTRCQRPAQSQTDDNRIIRLLLYSTVHPKKCANQPEGCTEENHCLLGQTEQALLSATRSTNARREAAGDPEVLSSASNCIQ